MRCYHLMYPMGVVYVLYPLLVPLVVRRDNGINVTGLPDQTRGLTIGPPHSWPHFDTRLDNGPTRLDNGLTGWTMDQLLRSVPRVSRGVPRVPRGVCTCPAVCARVARVLRACCPSAPHVWNAVYRQNTQTPHMSTVALMAHLLMLWWLAAQQCRGLLVPWRLAARECHRLQVSHERRPVLLEGLTR